MILKYHEEDVIDRSASFVLLARADVVGELERAEIERIAAEPNPLLEQMAEYRRALDNRR